MPKETKKALLDAAERAARIRGFDGFSYANLAKEVGVRTASIHYHFPTKADLSVSLMRRYAERMRETCAGIDAKETQAAGRLAGAIGLYRSALGNGEMLCLCVSFIGSLESLSPELIAEIKKYRAMMRDWLCAIFKQATEDGSIACVAAPSTEAASALALLEGAQLAARAELDISIFEDATALMRARLNNASA